MEAQVVAGMRTEERVQWVVWPEEVGAAQAATAAGSLMATVATETPAHRWQVRIPSQCNR